MSNKKKRKTKHSDSDEDDDVFYYRYCAASSSTITTTTTTTSNNQTLTQSQSKSKNKIGNTSTAAVAGGSAGETLAPSKSTVYVSNIDYSLTNSDLHTLFSTFGKIARVTVLKDRHTRQSKGVAFIQFVSRHDARKASDEMHRKVLNGRTLTASIAADNGRAPEFIKKRVYNTEIGRCFECGENGHLSYECPRNMLGPRVRPQPKRPRGCGGERRKRDGDVEEEGEEEEEDGRGVGGERFEEDNWASVVDDEADERLLGRNGNGNDESVDKKRKKGKRVGYFSDESDHDDDDD